MKLNPLKCAFGVGSGKFLSFMVNRHGIKANLKKINALLEISSPKKPNEVMSLTSKVVALSHFVSRAIDRCAPFFDVLKDPRSLSEQTNASKHSWPSKNT